jgi:nitroreductase
MIGGHDTRARGAGRSGTAVTRTPVALTPDPEETSMSSQIDHRQLSMPVGEAMFSQRAIRRFKPDAIPEEHLRLILEAAVRAPNGGNRQVGRFLVVTDRARIKEFGAIYREAWWAKRVDDHGWTKPEDIPRDDKNYQAAMRLADHMKDVPCVVIAMAVNQGPANSIIPAAQNLMLAARALGIGSVPTTLHAKVMDRFRALFKIPADVALHFCIPLGYPEGTFGPNVRKPIRETCFREDWGRSF